jgi:hypothetical protein
MIAITTNDPENTYNAMRLANTGVGKGDKVRVFGPDKGILVERASTEEFDVMGRVDRLEGDFFV